MTKSLKILIEQEAEDLRRMGERRNSKCLTQTDLMFRLMNSLEDSELEEMGIDLLDVAGEVMQYMIWEESGLNERVKLEGDK